MRRKGRERNFKVGETVMARNYGRGQKWKAGVVVKQSGPVSYQVKVGDLLWCRHVDQILETGLQVDDDKPPEPDVASPVIVPVISEPARETSHIPANGAASPAVQ